MRPVRISVTGAGVSDPIPIDQYLNPTDVGLGAVVSSGATVDYSVEHTFDDIWADDFTPGTATWFTHETIVNATANDDGNYLAPPSAIRLNVGTSDGTVTLNVIQAGAVS